MRQAGFEQVEVSLVAREEQEPHFETILACGIRPGGATVPPLPPAATSTPVD
jgi:hypothetical protein